VIVIPAEEAMSQCRKRFLFFFHAGLDPASFWDNKIKSYEIPAFAGMSAPVKANPFHAYCDTVSCAGMTT
jgi:hypothetical protein